MTPPDPNPTAPPTVAPASEPKQGSEYPIDYEAAARGEKYILECRIKGLRQVVADIDADNAILRAQLAEKDAKIESLLKDEALIASEAELSAKE